MELQSSAGLRGGALCALVYGLAFLVVASVLGGHFGFPLDDSWIHQVVARNLAEYKVLGFLPGVVTAGSTSLLWTLILAARPLLLPHLSPVLYCAALSILLLGATGFVLKRITEKDGLPPALAWCLALAPAASGNFLWFGMIGMEHLLFVLLCLMILSLWFDGDEPARPAGRLSLPLLCLLLVITRPEGICLLGLLLLTRRRARQSLRGWFGAALGAAMGATIAAAVNWKTGHHLTPLTMRGRNEAMASTSWVKLHGLFFGHSVARILSVWNTYLPEHVLHGRGLILGLPLLALLILLIALAVRRLHILDAHRLVLLCVWAAVIELLYAVMLPFPGHGGRYIAIVIMLFLPLVFTGLAEALAAMRLNQRAIWIAVAVAGLATATLSLTEWRRIAAADIDQIDTEHGAMADWIEHTVAPSDIATRRIAVFDIGRIGYQFHGNLIDLGGLVDHRFHSYLVAHRTSEYLRVHDVLYVVLPGDPDRSRHFYEKLVALEESDGANLTLIHDICAAPEVAKLAFASSGTAASCQRLYAIRYPSSASSARLATAPSPAHPQNQ